MLPDSGQNNYTHWDNIFTSATTLPNFGQSFLLFIIRDTYGKFRKEKISAFFQDNDSLKNTN